MAKADLSEKKITEIKALELSSILNSDECIEYFKNLKNIHTEIFNALIERANADNGGTIMETFKIKKDTSFETLDKTLLVVRDLRADHAVFWEFGYNEVTCEYDILVNKNRILTQEEIKVELYRSFGKNYKIVLDV